MQDPVLDMTVGIIVGDRVLKFINSLVNRYMNRKEDAIPASTEKECPMCLSKIPIEVVRCAFCTSQLS